MIVFSLMRLKRISCNRFLLGFQAEIIESMTVCIPCGVRRVLYAGDIRRRLLLSRGVGVRFCVFGVCDDYVIIM